MKELSLNILDITENSVKAGATIINILIDETTDTLKIVITDNGCGMSEEIVRRVTDPFYTTRTTRNVGMGIPLFKMEAEQTQGSFTIVSECEASSPENHGTCVTAIFNKNHIDYIPLGNVAATLVTLVQGHPDKNFVFCHTTLKGKVELDTRTLREVLGDEVPLSDYEVIKWIEEFLREQYNNL